MTIADVDTAVFKAINGLGFAPLDAAWIMSSTLEFGLTAAGLVAFYFAWRKKWDAVWIILAGVIAVALCDSVGARLIKPMFGRVRPCFELPPGTVRLLVQIGPSNSMPSLHAANNLTVALVAFLGERRTGWVLFPVALFVAMSRIGVGVHWPTDLLGGFLWGAICAVIAWGLSRLALRGWRRIRPAPAQSSAAPPTPPQPS
ncbi:MAG: phosphatase PAP2 family protein [Myxococcales bacterium]